MKLNQLAWIVPFTCSLLACADSDISDPEVMMIRVEDAGQVVTEIAPSGTSDTTITDDVPLTATLVVEFNEPINLKTAEERVHLTDTSGGEYTVELKQKLTELTVTPEGMFDPEVNHVLAIDKDIEDTTGEKTDRNLKVNFFTAPAP
jgi:hypothetical protein